jgi:putative spermidine/putrescine transport system substrate-binding protein
MEEWMSKKLGSMSLSRREVLRGAAAAPALAVASPMIAGAASKRIVFATWGGSWEKAMRDAWFDPFAKATGIEVVTAQGNTYGKLRAMVEAKNVEWDIAEVLPDFQYIGAKENLIEKLDFNVIDTSRIVKGGEFVTERSVPQVLWTRTMFYNTRQFSADNHPKNWADVWDFKRFPGKRTFSSANPNSGYLEAALLADGVEADKLFPLDIDRALKSLTRIRDDIVWYSTNAQAEQYMSDGQAVTGCVPDGRALSAIDHGAPVAIEYNQSFLTWSTMVIPRGAPNQAEAMKFLAYALTPEAQAAIAKVYTYGPVTPQAFELLPAERSRILSGGPQQQGKYILANEKWWGENLKIATDKVNAWRLG